MTESTSTDTLGPADGTEPVGRRDTRLYQVLAWVGIVAGVLFTVAVVFFSGFIAARTTDGYGWHRGYQNNQMRPGGPPGGGCPMMQGGGMGPGGMAPGGMAPGGNRAPTPGSPPTPPTEQR